MKEILVLSGKGGTGKTTITGSLAYLMPDTILADCDVDAADLHLLLAPKVRQENEFWSGVTAEIDSALCSGCGTCAELCHFEAIRIQETAKLIPFACEGCGVCAHFCPEGAIRLPQKRCGLWFVSDTDCGPMVHAQLGIGEENSGKLVSLVKRKTRDLAEERGMKWILVDGPPGIGCPVIASMSGADFVLLVTEPTTSGLHDLKRVVALTEHFKLPTGVCINKWDLHEEMSDNISRFCVDKGVAILGKIPFDPAVVSSMVTGSPLMLSSNSGAAGAIATVWHELQHCAGENHPICSILFGG